MRKLVKWGRGKYLDRLYGDVAAENEPMKQLAASLGFQPIPHPNGTPGLVRMVLELYRKQAKKAKWLMMYGRQQKLTSPQRKAR